MSFDALTLAAVRDELEPLLTLARLQKLIFVDELSLAVETFAPSVGRANLLLSAHLERGRIQRIPQLPPRGVERDSPFSLLVRKHLRNARVRSVRQPPLERVLELTCEQHDSADRAYSVLLIVEAMGRRSNLVLVDDDGVIMDAARRTPPSRNSRRPVLPHLPYAPPPPQDRLLPEALSADSLRTSDSGLLLTKHLAERVAGLSPIAARELAFRCCGSATITLDAVSDWADVAEVARAFVTAHDWSPCVAFDAEERPIDYAPYELRHLAATGARLERFVSISDAMTTYYSHVTAGGPLRRGDPLAAERKALLAPLERSAQTTARRIAALDHQLTMGQSEREPLRQVGELLLAYQSEVPEAAEEVTLDGQRIELDPRLSAVENAQAYFARYRKAREAEERVPELLDQARQSLEYLAELRALVEVADQMDAIRALRREVAGATGASSSSVPGGGRGQKTPSKSAPYRRVALAGGWEALVGTSAAANAVVTFEAARGDDLWLHARGVPGAHVILRGGVEPPPEVIERAAQLAAAHSSARSSTAVEVDVTQRRYVKKIPGAPPGLVRYANERTLRVTPQSQ